LADVLAELIRQRPVPTRLVPVVFPSETHPTYPTIVYGLLTDFKSVTDVVIPNGTNP
jgi:hypothetical protein